MDEQLVFMFVLTSNHFSAEDGLPEGMQTTLGDYQFRYMEL